MKGSIVKRGEKYAIVVDVGRDAFGKRKQRWFSGFNSRKEAEKELPRILIKLQDGELLDNNNITLGKFIKDWINDKKKKDNLSVTTIDGYENIIDNHVIPTIGELKLQNVKPYNMQKYFDLKSEILSARTLNNHSRVLISAFIHAVDMELIEKNPMDKVKLPKDKKEETTVLDVEQSKELLEKVQSNQTLKMPVTLALLLGLRRGECLALRWDNVDFQSNTIKITETLEYVKGEYYFNPPKTKKSRRTIAIPQDIIPILKQHKKWQNEMQLKSGGSWKNEKNLICTNKLSGDFIIPTVLSDAFRNFLIKNNLPKIRFHDLRHTNATLMLAAGVSAKVAGNRLGHSSISITMDLYSHVLESIDQDAANKLNTILDTKGAQ